MSKNIEISGIKLINRIDDTLKDQNKTRKYLCEKLNIFQGTMATWKTKNIMPPVKTLYKIAAELNVSLNWLILGDDFFNVSIQTKDLPELLVKYSQELLQLEKLSSEDFFIIKSLLNKLSKN